MNEYQAINTYWWCVAKKLSNKEQAEREDRLCEYRATGWTDAQIMVKEGYSSVQAANAAVLKAVRKRSRNDNPDAIRDDADITSDFLRKELSKVAVNPPPVHSAIGRLIADPTTCTCGNRLASAMSEHEHDCQVQPVKDESVRVRALSELRKVSSDHVDMHGARKRQPISESEALRQMYAWLAAEFPERYTMTAEVIRELDQVPDGDTSPDDAP